MSNTRLSEQLHKAYTEWADKKAAADFRDNMKTAFLAQRIKERGDIPYSHAERDVKASPEWKQYITDMVEATRQANIARRDIEVIKAKMTEWQNDEANHRAQTRL